MSEFIVNLQDGRSFPAQPLRVRAADRLILVLVQRLDMPDLRPFWVQSKGLRLVPGTFPDFCLAMRSVPGWVEHQCEDRITNAIVALKVAKARAGGGKETGVAPRAAKGGRIPAA